MGTEAGYMYFSVVSDHIQYSVSQFWMENDNKKAIIVPVLAPDLARLMFDCLQNLPQSVWVTAAQAISWQPGAWQTFR